MIARAIHPTGLPSHSGGQRRSTIERRSPPRAGAAWIQKHTVAYVAVGFLLGVTLGCLIKRK
jgi:hypothetical protein